MEQLSKYDPYRIEGIQFYMNKKTKHTTFKSLLLSFTIICLSIIISFESLQQIWAPRSEIDFFSSERVLSGQQFTKSPICIVSIDSNTNLPQVTFSSYFLQNNTIIEAFEASNQFDQDINVMTIIGSKNYVCYNLQNIILNGTNYLQLSVSGIANILMNTYSVEAVLEGNSQYQLFTDSLNTLQRSYSFYFQKFKATIHDKLIVDYQPERIYGLSTSYSYVEQFISSNEIKYNFFTQISARTWVTTQIVIKRMNIGEILGIFFSWFTILFIVFAFSIAPIVQHNFKLNLAKNIYDNKNLDKVSNSLFSQFKYILSNFKSDIFEQEIVQIAFNQLDQDLNILSLIRNQILMNKLIKQNKTLDINKQSYQLVQNQGYLQKQEESFQLLLKQDNSFENIAKKQMIKQNSMSSYNEEKKCKLQTKRQQSIQRSNIFINSIKYLDIGQTTISLLSNKGEGYGTNWNFILTVIFVFCTFFFLIFAGFFTVLSSTQVSTVLSGQDDSFSSIQIMPNNFVYRAIKQTTFDSFSIEIQLIDQNYEKIMDLTPFLNTSCDGYAHAIGQSGSQWICFNQSISLKNNGKNQKHSIVMYMSFPFFPFTSSYIQLAFPRTYIQNTQLKTQIQYFISYYSSSDLKSFSAQMIYQTRQNTRNQEIPTINNNNLLWSFNYPDQLTNLPINGIMLELLPQTQKLYVQESTIWDVIDNTWGIVILFFTIFLTRIAVYINSRTREKITSLQENQTRNNIINIIQTYFQLAENEYEKQLCIIKYFYKNQIQQIIHQ